MRKGNVAKCPFFADTYCFLTGTQPYQLDKLVLSGDENMSETGITAEAKAPQKTPWGAVFLFCLLFFIFGFVTWLNGPLITFVKLAFQLSDVEAFLVPSVFFLSWPSFCARPV
jgi:hypothetical protein